VRDASSSTGEDACPPRKYVQRMPDGDRHDLLLSRNDILTDDDRFARRPRLRESLAGDDRVDVGKRWSGPALLDFMVGYRAVVIVDSIQTGRAPAGTIHEVDAAG